ncbi:hypothetical protein Tco_1493597 [Tanacetum coccineum]
MDCALSILSSMQLPINNGDNQGANNLILMEIALKIASKIRAHARFSVYIVARGCSNKCKKNNATDVFKLVIVILVLYREHLKKQHEKTKNQKEKLESLCRSLQAERKQNLNGQSNPDSVPAV